MVLISTKSSTLGEQWPFLSGSICDSLKNGTLFKGKGSSACFNTLLLSWERSWCSMLPFGRAENLFAHLSITCQIELLSILLLSSSLPCLFIRVTVGPRWAGQRLLTTGYHTKKLPSLKVLPSSSALSLIHPSFLDYDFFQVVIWLLILHSVLFFVYLPSPITHTYINLKQKDCKAGPKICFILLLQYIFKWCPLLGAVNTKECYMTTLTSRFSWKIRLSDTHGNNELRQSNHCCFP